MSQIQRIKMSPLDVQKFQEFLMESSGLYFEGRRIGDMERAIVDRMIELSHQSFSDYYHFLTVHRSGREELNKLVLSLTVGETRFFRTPDQFAAIRKYILPELIESKSASTRSLRILSAGCATGEEAYTLGIMLCEALPDIETWDIKIIGRDINKDFLAHAKQATYHERKLKLVDNYLKEKYFDSKGQGLYRVKRQVRNLVDISHFNLSEPDYLELLQDSLFDLILCRNVLIYFKQETIKRVISRIFGILADRGYLLLGYSETLFKLNDKFLSIHTPEAFFYRKGNLEKPRLEKELPHTETPLNRNTLLDVLGSRPHPKVSTRIVKKKKPRAARKPEKTKPQTAQDESLLWEEGMGYYSRERFNKARQSFKAMLEINPFSARAHLGLGFLYANSGADERSREAIARAREYDELMPEIYYLLALLAEKNEKLSEAITNHQRVILLDPDFAMAHFSLANIYLRLDKLKDARREFRNTLNILESDQHNSSLKFSGGMSREALIQACRMHSAPLRAVK